MHRIHLLPRKEIALLHRHPWVYRSSISKSSAWENGTIVAVHAADGNFLAYGFWSAEGAIAVRCFGFERQVEDQIGLEYWMQKVERVTARREGFRHGDVCRWIHGEADGFPGLFVDVMDARAWIRLQTAGALRVFRLLQTWFQAQGIRDFILRPSPDHLPGGSEVPASAFKGLGRVVIQERMERPFLGSKISFELCAEQDWSLENQEYQIQRDLQHGLLQNKRVWIGFAGSGLWSIAALAAGATEVLAVDHTPGVCAESHRLVKEWNPESHGRYQTQCGDVFEALRQMPKNAYDVVILDPPAMAFNAVTVTGAQKAYRDLNLQAFKKLAPGAWMWTLSSSAHLSGENFLKILQSAAADAGRDVVVHQTLGPGIDFPQVLAFPEGIVLKGFLLRVD
jgi:23S rRNA (cytosine1962-C5)-methyltransferase